MSVLGCRWRQKLHVTHGREIFQSSRGFQRRDEGGGNSSISVQSSRRVVDIHQLVLDSQDPLLRRLRQTQKR